MLGTWKKLLKGRRLDRAVRAVIEAVEGRVMLAGNGLAATYFDNADLTGKTVSRVDGTVNFDWGTGGPATGIAADTFSARWTGQVQAAKSETYTFYTTSDDGVRLWVDGKLIINNWTTHAPREDKGMVSLQAGKNYNFKLEYFDQSYGAVMKLLWSSASTAKQVIPQSQLYSSVPVTPTPTPTPANGNGLLGTYWDNDNFTGSVVQRTDRTVDFNWGTGTPISGFGTDTYSARWAGQVLAPSTGDYTFYTTSDDGVRVWVNGQQIINNWTVHAPVENSGKIRLEAGKKYDIKVEYFDKAYGAVMQLRWSGPGFGKQIIPTANLFSATPVNQPSPVEPTPVPPASGQVVNGLLATYYGTTTFGGNAVTRVEGNVAFDWGTSSPDRIIVSNGWSARWVGQIKADKSETYTFSLTSQGGARLWVNGKLIIDHWTAHAKGEKSGSIALVAGQKYDIKMEYYDPGGSAVMQLRWSSASTAKAFVPNANLFATLPVYAPIPGIPAPSPTGPFKVYTSKPVNFRPGSSTDKTLTVDGYRISKLPIDTKGLNIAVTDLVPGQKAWAYSQITIKNTEISDVYRTPGYHNDFIRIAGAAGRQDSLINVDLENINLHDGTAIPILITDGDYDTIVIRNVKISNASVAQVQINTQQVGSVKRVIIENCPGLHVAFMGRVGTLGECLVRNSPGAEVADSLNQQGTKSGVRITVLP